MASKILNLCAWLSKGPGLFYRVSENWPAGSVLEKLTSLELGWRKCFLFNLLPRHQGTKERWQEFRSFCAYRGSLEEGSVSGYVLIHKKKEGSQSALTV